MPLRLLACCIATTFAAAPSPAQEAAQEAGAPPAPAEAMSAYRAVDGWVRAWNVGKVEVFRPEDPQVPRCAAVSVTLRLAGEVIGRGVEVAQDDTARASIVADATRAALAEAEPKLGVSRDAMYEATVKDLAKRITISLQLAGELIPISPKDAAEAMAMVAPGVEGVGARLGDRLAVNFPERMLSSATEPGPALGTLVGKLADDPALAIEPLSKLAKDNGAVFYRFRVTHVAQTNAGDTPVFLHRCGKVIRTSMINEAELRVWADRLANQLVDGKFLTSALRGTLDPVRGEADSTYSASSSLLASIALLSYINLAGLHEARLEQVQFRISVLRPIAMNGETPASIELDSACLALIVESRQMEWKGAWIKRRGEALGWSNFYSFSDQKVRPIAMSGALPENESPAGWGMLAEASTRVLPPWPDAQRLIAEVFKQTPPNQIVSAMPWLGWGVLRCYREGDIPSAVALREMRSQLWQHQLQPDTLPLDQQDLAGGIVFTASRQPMPTWQSARPLAFIATMLGDPRLTEDKEVSEELSRLLLSLRFLRQLTAGEAECFMYKNPERALGGVRSSLWDQRMPPEATAMTLLTVCETLRSLEEIEKRRADK